MAGGGAGWLAGVRMSLRAIHLPVDLNAFSSIRVGTRHSASIPIWSRSPPSAPTMLCMSMLADRQQQHDLIAAWWMAGIPLASYLYVLRISLYAASCLERQSRASLCVVCDVPCSLVLLLCHYTVCTCAIMTVALFQQEQVRTLQIQAYCCTSIVLYS